MAMKQYAVKLVKGMNQDIGIQSTTPEVAYKLLNIKNQILDNNDTEVLSNEKGTSKVLIKSDGVGNYLFDNIPGKILGTVKCLKNSSVIFVRNSDDSNTIYKIFTIDGDIYMKVLAQGNFNFGDNIKGIFCYENSELQKVYWVDGVNQLRYINIADSNFYSDSNPNGKLPITDEIYMNSSPEFKLGHKITVERIPGGGTFSSGVIQYAFTYYMKYGAETGVVDFTPLYYISEVDKGLEADESIGCSFKVTIEYPDTRYDYIRLYSIQRTSLNGTPIVKLVKDIKLK